MGAALGLDVLGTFHVDQEAFLVGHLRVAPGGGLDGLAQRAAAVDGTLTIDSPPGGPTRITVELPCES